MRRRGPSRRESRTTNAYLDSGLVENANVLLFQILRGTRPHLLVTIPVLLKRTYLKAMDGDKDVEMEVAAGEPATSPATVKGTAAEQDQGHDLGPSSPAEGDRPSDTDVKQG